MKWNTKFYVVMFYFMVFININTRSLILSSIYIIQYLLVQLYLS